MTQRSFVHSCLLSTLGLLGVFLFLSVSTAAETPGPVRSVGAALAQETKDLPRHTLIYGGDAFCARRLNYALLSPNEADRKKLFGAVASLFTESDLAMINLEGMVSTGGYYNRLRGASYMYRAFPNVVDVLKDAGIDLVTIANNHNGDYGPEAQVETVDHLALAGIGFTGAGVNWADAARPVYRKVGDTVVAIVGMELSDAAVYKAEENRPGVHFLHRAFQNPEDDQAIVDHLKEVVQEARRHAHIVIFSPHWANWDDEPHVTPPMRALAGKLIRESGFDAVLGHGVHLPEGVEIFDGKPVVYDAGNCLADFDTREAHLRNQVGGMLWKAEFSKAGVHRLVGIPLHMRLLETRLAEDGNNNEALRHVAKSSREYGTTLRVEDGRIHIDLDPGDVQEPTERPEAPSRPAPATVRLAPTDVLHERLPEGVTPLDVRYENGIRLVGYELVQSSLVPGSVVAQTVVMYWTTDRPIEGHYVIHLDSRPIVDGKLQENVVIRQEAHLPGDWVLPTDQWPVGKIIQDKQHLRSTFRGRRTSEGIAFFGGLRRWDEGAKSTLLAPIDSGGIELLDGKLVPLGQSPVSKDAPSARESYVKWRESRKVELSPRQPLGAPPLIWPPEFGGD